MRSGSRQILLIAISGLALVFAYGRLAQAQDQYYDWEEYVPFSFHSQPTVGLYYGLTNSSLESVRQPLADPGFLQVKLGYSRTNTYDYSTNILKHSFKHISVSHLSQRLDGAADPGNIRSDTWRVAGTFESGYGYGLSRNPSGASILLIHGSGWNWSSVSFKDSAVIPEDQQILESYEDGIRFGTNVEVGLRVRVIPLLAVDAGFERSIIFRRHLFWKWAGSALLEGGLQWILDRFIGKIARSTPEAAPVINILLKGALSYGFYEARKSNMNWPFSTEAPILDDTFKFGVTFMF
jgi:hypothetical protein